MSNSPLGPTAPPIPFYKSTVAMGIIVSLIFKLVAMLKPEWANGLTGMEAEATQIVLLVISALGDAVAFFGRVAAKLQPLKFFPGGSSGRNYSNRVRMVAPLLAVPLLALMLSACVQTAKPVVVSDRTVVVDTSPTTVVDDAIARYSPELAQYCGTIRTVLSLGSWVLSDARHVVLLNKTQAAVAAYCVSPPANVQQALAVLSQIWAEANRAGVANRNLRRMAMDAG